MIGEKCMGRELEVYIGERGSVDHAGCGNPKYGA